MPESGPPPPSARAPRGAAAGRRRVSLGLCLAGGLGLALLGTVRWLRDGSFWLDEASIAINLLAVPGPLDLLGPLPTGHSFPRLPLLTIAGLERAIGYGTLGLRALPWLAFGAGVVAWLRVLWLRARDQPALLAATIVLAYVPATWVAYGAMFKPYSLDVLLALVPFLLSDDWLARRLRAGRGRAGLAWATLPMLFSFTYGLAWLGRLVGWWLAGLPHGRRAVDRRSLGVALACLAIGAGAAWALDLRHTAAQAEVFAFWRRCIPGEVGFVGTAALAVDLVRGWYTGTPFGGRPALPGPLAWGLVALFALGAVEAVRRAVSPAATDSPTLARWGSRSLGALAVLGGVIAAGVVFDYPICRGRLTLFALFAVQLLTLEGLHALGHLGGGGAWRRRAAAGVAVLVALLALPAAGRNAAHLLLGPLPEDVRPLLPIVAREPDWPIVVAACSTRQLATLPEWLGDPRVVYAEERTALGEPPLPEAPDLWLVSAGTPFYCPWWLEAVRERAATFTARHPRGHTAQLYHVRPAPGAAGGATSPATPRATPRATSPATSPATTRAPSAGASGVE